MSKERERRRLLDPFLVELVLGVAEAIAALIVAGFQKAVRLSSQQPSGAGGRR